MSPVSLDCSLLITPSVFSNVYLSCVLCTICRQFLWNVHCWLPLRCSLTFICPVSCVLFVASFSGLFIVDYPFGVLQRLFVLFLVYYMWPVSLNCSLLIALSVFSNVYLSCVLCTICCQFLWIVHCWLPLRCSLTFSCLVSCVLYVASFSGLFIMIAPSVFSNVYLSCVLWTICCQFLWIVHFDYPFGVL